MTSAGGDHPAIISLEDFTESINMIIYAEPGVGKTVLAGTAPDALFLAIEAGTVSAKRQHSNAKLWPINTWDDLQEAYEWLEQHPDRFRWVIIDTATQMQRLCMRGILDKAVEENESRDLDVPAIQDWNKYYLMFQRFCQAFNSLPINILYLCHTMIKEDEEGETVILPEIAGPSHSPLRESQALCASVGVIGYYKESVTGKGDDVTTRRSLLFKGMPPYIAKDRYDVFSRWVAVTTTDAKGKTIQLTTMADIDTAISNSRTGRKPAAKKVAAKAIPSGVAAKAKAANPVKATPAKKTTPAIRQRPGRK